MMFSSDDATKSWGCSKCRGDDFEEGDKHRDIRNCDSEKNLNIAWDWMPDLRRCPWSQIDGDAFEAIGWWNEYEEFGVLPWGGSDLMAQPAYVLEVFVLCSDLKKRVTVKQAREEKSKWQKIEKSGSR